MKTEAEERASAFVGNDTSCNAGRARADWAWFQTWVGGRGTRARGGAAKEFSTATRLPLPGSLAASSALESFGRSLPAASACNFRRPPLRSLRDKRPSRYSSRKKSSAEWSFFCQLHAAQQETTLRYEFCPDLARGTT